MAAVRTVPDPAIGIDLRIGGAGQRPVHRLPIRERRGPIDRRASQGVTKQHSGAELEQAVRLRRGRRFDAQAQPLPRPDQQHGIASWLGCGEQQKALRLARQIPQPSSEALLDTGRDW